MQHRRTITNIGMKSVMQKLEIVGVLYEFFVVKRA